MMLAQMKQKKLNKLVYSTLVTVLYSVGHAIRLDVWKMREQLHALFTKKK